MMFRIEVLPAPPAAIPVPAGMLPLLRFLPKRLVLPLTDFFELLRIPFNCLKIPSDFLNVPAIALDLLLILRLLLTPSLFQSRQSLLVAFQKSNVFCMFLFEPLEIRRPFLESGADHERFHRVLSMPVLDSLSCFIDLFSFPPDPAARFAPGFIRSGRESLARSAPHGR